MASEQRMPVEHEQTATAGWRHTVATGLYQSGLLQAFQVVSRGWEIASDNGSGRRLRRVRGPKYLVLGYHGVGAHDLPLYCRLPKSAFAMQMRYLKRHYRLLSLRQMEEELQNPAAQGEGVVVTFDDGYLGTYTDAFPILREYAIPATVYLTVGSIESGELAWYDQIFLQFERATSDVTVSLDGEREIRLGDFATRVEAATALILHLRTLPDDKRRQWCESLMKTMPIPQAALCGSMMNWDQVREMLQAGISFGCHTMTHPVVSRLTPDALSREVGDSKALMENRLGVQTGDFAFPFGKPGDCGSIGGQVLSALGFRTAMTTIMGINQTGADKFRLRRMVQGEESSVAMFACRLQEILFRPIDEELAGATASTDS